MRKLILALAVAGMIFTSLLAGGAYAFRWRYDHVPDGHGRTTLVRTNRFTGTSERLSTDGMGWLPMDYELNRPPDPPCTAEQLASTNQYDRLFCDSAGQIPPPR